MINNVYPIICEYKSLSYSKRQQSFCKNIMYSRQDSLEKPFNVMHKNGCIAVFDKSAPKGVLNYSLCDAKVIGDNYPEYYKGKKYLFINHIESSEEHKGIGTLLIKEAIKESIKRGCEGRICLNTTTINNDKGSPVPFYYKIGFESSRTDYQSQIKNSVENNLPLPKQCEATTMFLPYKKYMNY